MILTYKECIEKFGNDYQLAKAVAEEGIYRVESGVYSTERYSSELEIIVKKYPNAIMTGEYALFCEWCLADKEGAGGVFREKTEDE